MEIKIRSRMGALTEEDSLRIVDSFLEAAARRQCNVLSNRTAILRPRGLQNLDAEVLCAH
jgi:hypothetical protein